MLLVDIPEYTSVKCSPRRKKSLRNKLQDVVVDVGTLYATQSCRKYLCGLQTKSYPDTAFPLRSQNTFWNGSTLAFRATFALMLFVLFLLMRFRVKISLTIGSCQTCIHSLSRGHFSGCIHTWGLFKQCKRWIIVYFMVLLIKGTVVHDIYSHSGKTMPVLSASSFKFSWTWMYNPNPKGFILKREWDFSHGDQSSVPCYVTYDIKILTFLYNRTVIVMRTPQLHSKNAVKHGVYLL